MSPAPSARTVAQVFDDTVSARANYPALRDHRGDVAWTWVDYSVRVRDCAAGLAGIGCERGEVLACWVRDRPEFHVADTAAAHLGVGTLSIYPSSTAAEAARAIAAARCRVLVTERSFLEPALEVRASGTTRLQTIVCVDDGGNETTLSWQELIECAHGEFDLGAAAAAVTPDDLVTIIYTVGADRPPTQVRLTNADVIARIVALGERFALRDGWRAISWQPITGIAERLSTHYLPLAYGWHVTTCADPGAVVASLPEIRPEFFWAQPGLWEEMRTSVLGRFRGDVQRAAADRAAVLAGLGLEQVHIAIVSASCPLELIGFWRAMGIPLNIEELCSQ